MKPLSAVTHAPGHVREIAPYVAGKPIEELARELGLDPATIVKLASNENPRGPGPRVRAAVAAAVGDLPRYPDSNGFALKAALSQRLSVPPEQLVLGNGSNDILELVSLALLAPGDEAVYAQYGFVVYPLAIKARGARGIEVPAHDYGHDLQAMRRAITPRTRIVYIANPNNPTGTWVPPGPLEAFVASVPPEVVVVLDEAYNEYLEPSNRVDTVAWIARYPNLAISRTFSKAFGLAALRVGYGVMHASLADLLNRVRQPFNVNSIAQAAAIAALADEAYVEESRQLNAAGYAQLVAGLTAFGIPFVPSHANFVLAHVGDADRVNRLLLEQGVIVRPVANYGLPGSLRVTVGLPDENTRFLSALARTLPRDR